MLQEPVPVQMVLSCLPGASQAVQVVLSCLPGASQAVQMVLSCLPGASQAVQVVLSCLSGASQAVQMGLSCLPGASLVPRRLSNESFRASLVPPCRNGPFLPPRCLLGCPNGTFLPPWRLHAGRCRRGVWATRAKAQRPEHRVLGLRVIAYSNSAPPGMVPGRQERTTWTAREAPGRHQGCRKPLKEEPVLRGPKRNGPSTGS